jgi:hypothetical protein
MITAIEIENFKAIGKRVRVELKPLTLLFGPNSAGKSTIIQALHCAREIFERHNLDPDRTVSGGEAFDLGGFANIVHGHDLSRAIGFRFELDLTSRDLPDYSDEILNDFKSMDEASEAQEMLSHCRSASVEVEVQWIPEAQLPSITRYGVDLNGRPLVKMRVPDKPIELEGKRFAVAVVEIDFAHPLLSEAGFSEFGPLAGRLSVARSIIASARFELKRKVPSALPVWRRVLNLEDSDALFADETDTVTLPNSLERDPATTTHVVVTSEWPRDWVTRVALTKMIVGPGEALLDELHRLRYLGPIREMPPRSYVPPIQPDRQRWATGLGAWDRLHDAGQDFLDRVNTWSSRLNCGYTVRLKHYREVEQGVTPDERQPLKSRVVLVPAGQAFDVLPNDVGIGISQLLPAVVLALDADEGIVAIEQPDDKGNQNADRYSTHQYTSDALQRS